MSIKTLFTPLRRLFGYYETYHGNGRPLLKFIGIIGSLTYLSFYLIRFTKPNPKPFDDIGIRAFVITLFALLAAHDQWPEKLKKFYLPYSYAALIVCMPFVNVYVSLERGGGVPAMSNCFIALSFLVMLTDWRNTIAMLLVGISMAASLFFALHPGGHWPADMLAQIPAYLIILIGGGAFKLSEKQIDSEKSRLAAALAGSIAHEMRNPLSRILYALEKMQAVLARPKVHESVKTLEGEQIDALYRHLADSEGAVRRGLQVISMTLDGVSNKPMDATGFRYLSAAEVVQQAVEEYGYESDDARNRVSVKIESDFTFRGDETAYLFVLFNLIKNALYYAAAYPRLHVTLTVGDQQVKVHDTGPGIPADVRKTLFEVFRSVGKSGGTGLGLTYCQRVMHAFGGDIRCDSVPEEFTEFSMTFPKVTDEERERHRLEVIAEARTVLAGKRLLVVEDDEAQRAMTLRKLEAIASTTEIDQAADGQLALRMLAERKYDLVLLDLRMPGLDGYAVAERVRGGDSMNRGVHIVAYSSEPAHLSRFRALQSGMDHFLSKPCAEMQLLANLQHIIRRRGATSVSAASRLAGRRILVADDSAFNRKAIAAYLRNAAAFVIEVEHGAAVLQQLRAQEGIDAVIVDLHMPGMDGLETARAIRASREGWCGVPIVAMTARSDEPAVAAATAAGMNGFLVKPVDALVLYDTLSRLITGGSAMAPHPEAPRTREARAESQDHDGMLNLQRLESYRRLGMLDELLNDYLPEMQRLVSDLQKTVDEGDVQGSIDALHSLLGMSGEAGAQALYQNVRRLYVPLLEEGLWPSGQEWLPQLQALAARTEEALKAYCAQQAASGAAS
ncbi:response regulator [Ramlibacter ginsenosidimutans]|uniref:histidine kinase n=1 Tax=Ramlibacter ginsenosidimutans TaxID=502333 RepID=A0A934TW47_9BURK|nr:response regulator [Ramlibacter ginsenosidimutans]MBK6007807.1 response regulator [Ramlibacter ginsenosidimutans]